jgi:bacterioferritin-associated ferredoxin
MKKTLTNDGSRIICACFEITEKQITDYLHDSSNTIDDLIIETGIGSKCTACLLDFDLLLDKHFKQKVKINKSFEHDKIRNEEVKTKFKVYLNERESGFFINDEKISTTLTFANYGELFEKSETLPTYNYRLRLYDESGKKHVDIGGNLSKYEQKIIRFSSLTECPEKGWFLLSLKAVSDGMQGSIRPQFMLSGNGFSATVHTQPHKSACRGKAVILFPQKSGYNTTIPVINPYRKKANINFVLVSITGQIKQSIDVELPSLGVRFVNIDHIMKPEPCDIPLLLTVKSDIPVRKHVINQLGDNRLSIDHFPNSK